MDKQTKTVLKSGKTQIKKIVVYQCEFCGSHFANKTSLISHIKWKHEQQESKICEGCNKRFTRNANLKRHQAICNGEGTVFKRTTVSCSLCDFQGRHRTTVFEHYITDHDQDLTKKQIEFDTFEEFEEWKQNFENETKSRFRKYSGDRRLKSGPSIRKYICFRDGNFFSKSKGMRNIKVQGSNKINSYCPAEINAIISGNRVEVTYIDTHIGHECDAGRLLRSERRGVRAQKVDEIEISFDLDHEEIVHEDDDASEDFENRKRMLLDSVVQSFDKIVTEEQLEAASRHITAFDEIIDSSPRERTVSLPLESIQKIIDSSNRKVLPLVSHQKLAFQNIPPLVFISTKKKIKLDEIL